MFTFILSTYSGLELVLRPINTFDNIKIKVDHRNYKKLFKQAIKKMNEYNRGL